MSHVFQVLRRTLQPVRGCIATLVVLFTLFSLPSSAIAQQKLRPPRSAIDAVFDRLSGAASHSTFGPDFRVQDVVLDNLDEKNTEREKAADATRPETKRTLSDVERKSLQSAFGAPQVRPVPDAPSSFVELVSEIDRGNELGARAATSRFVDYLGELMFKVMLITRLIGEERVRRNEMSEEELEGALDLFAKGMADARRSQNFPFEVSFETALKHVKPDPNGEVSIYYFFTLSCSYCRLMAPDIERLWRATAKDPHLRMAVLTLGPQPKRWIEEYRNYTGLTMPIMDGANVAKKLGVTFAPTVVVVTESTNTAYRVVGQQDFRQLLTFVRHAQGKTTTESTFSDPALQKLILSPIGEGEKNLRVFGRDGRSTLLRASVEHTPRRPQVVGASVERF